MSRHPQDYAFDWPDVFRVGDVVRSTDGNWLGVVVAIEDFSTDQTPQWELHVDGAKCGAREGRCHLAPMAGRRRANSVAPAPAQSMFKTPLFQQAAV